MPVMFFGDTGDDTLEGSKSTGNDSLYGDEDNDTIYANGGGQDFVYGGTGHDAAVIDISDYVKDVEKIVQ